MHYGIALPNGGVCGDPRTLADCAALAEEAGWDGSCRYKHTYGGPWEDWTPADVRAFKAMADHERGAGRPFDVALGGRHRSEDWTAERALIKALAKAGATWWIEYLPPEIGGQDEFRRAVQRGPLRVVDSP